jgi:hypothetical protein
MFGYNDMNTYSPNPFVTQGNIVLSGAGRKVDLARMRKAEKEYEPKYELHGSGMDGAGWMDDIKKGYNKTKSAVKSETGQKIKKALMEDKDFMKEFNKAKKQLKDYSDGKRKTKPGKAAMAILEQAGVISKIEDEFRGAGNKSGKISRIKKAKKWEGFAKDTAYDGIDLARYGYENFKEATNPVQAEAKKAAKGIAKMFGGAKSPSPWIQHVKAFSQKHNIPYKEALSKAGPSYRQLKNKM